MTDKTLATLIKINRRKVDDARRLLLDCQFEVESLKQERDRLLTGLALEQVKASDSLFGTQTFPAYLERVREQQTALDRQELEAMRAVRQARAGLARAFQELKRFEIVEQDQRRKARAEANRLEQIGMDETASRRTSRGRPLEIAADHRYGKGSGHKA